MRVIELNVKTLSRFQKRKKGLAILKEGLGVKEFIKFMQDFGLNEGDYTKDRAKWLKENSVDEIISNMKKS